MRRDDARAHTRVYIRKMWDLCDAAMSGDLEEVKRLIRNGAEIDERDFTGKAFA